MQAGTVTIDPNQSGNFVGSDGRLEVNVPTGAVNAADVSAAGGSVKLKLQQIAPASGSTAGGSGIVSLGTYLIQVTNSAGQLAAAGLRAPLTIRLHYDQRDRAFDLRHAILATNIAPPEGTNLNPLSGGSQLSPSAAGLGTPASMPLTQDPSSQTLTAALSASSPSTTLSFNTNSPVASFGKPDPFSSDLATGSLTAGYPIDVPKGPGGLTPDLQLGYSSAAVAEQHNPQAAAPWVGEGWSLSMGSISWSEHNVAESAPPANWEDTWLMNDSFGTATELIPPNTSVATYNQDSPNGISASPVAWHTATETHAKVFSYTRTATLASAPKAVSWGSGRIDVFARGSDNALWHIWYDASSGGWGIWENLGGNIASAPEPTSWGVGRLDVFAIGQDGTLSHIFFDSAHGGWSSWASQGAPSGIQLKSDPGAVSWGAGRIDVFEQGSDNALWHIFYDASAGGWNPWKQTSNALTLMSGPDVSSWGGGRLDVFARDSSQLQHLYYASSTGWSSWTALGTPSGFQLVNDPGAVSWGSGRIDVFVEGSDQALWHIYYDQSTGGWATWSSNSGSLTASPDVASWGVGRLDVFSRDRSNALSHIFYDSSVGGWNAWASNGVPTLPCFRAFLPTGLMEEFGCTPDSLQYYPVPIGTHTGTEYIANWLLDLITDPTGNQIHVTYSQDLEQGYAGKAYPRDAELATVEYDSPACHSAQTACLGNNWAPLMRVSFSSSVSVTSFTGPTCPANGNLRCDDPVDLSGSGGLASPTVQNTLVLNEIDVQVRGSATSSWNTLRKYQLSYEQTGPTTTVDPATGSNESTAGKLNLTQLVEKGADGATSLPARTFTYSPVTEYYEDSAYHPTPSTNCGPAWNTGVGQGCYLWSQSYAGNSSYLTSSSNGLGLGQTFTWALAHGNTHGTGTNGAPGNPFACATQNTPPCNVADDQNWSHVALTQETGSVVTESQIGQGGSPTNSTITSTIAYDYSLAYPLVAQACSDCVAGFTWGNQKDGDYSDFYNGKFMGFAVATVKKLDSFEVHKFHSTLGWGVYDCTQVSFGCAADHGIAPRTYCYSPCNNDPWWPLSGQSIVNALHGHEYELDVFTDSNQQTLLRKSTTTYPTSIAGSCPSQNVLASPPNGDGNWDSQLVSELDPSNPVALCDLQQSQRDDFTEDGSTNANLPHRTTTYAYDQYGRLTNETTTSNDGAATGSATTIVQKRAYVWNDGIATSSTSASGPYLIDFPSLSTIEDASGNRFACTYTSYDGQANGTGQSATLTVGEITRVDRYSNCGTMGQGFNDRSDPLTTTHTYDLVGNLLTTTDPDANAGISSHLGCRVNASTYSECFAYDSTFAVLPTSTTNALNQTDSTAYQSPSSGTSAGGFGLWPVSTTDPNSQTTSYGYDALGRPTSQTLPGEGSGLTTTATSYTAWCSGPGAQTPCLEIDHMQRLNSTTTVTSRAFYDGWGHLVETRVPAPGGQDAVRYAVYDKSGRLVQESVSYFVTAYGGPAGAAAYSVPDSSQKYSVHGYDGLGRLTSTTDPLNHQTTNTISVVCNVPATGDSACYEQTLTVDALGHQGGGLVDALGRKQYLQRFTGNSPATYAVYATTKYTYDVNDNLTQILEPDGSSKATFAYDTAGRESSMTDPDLGTVSYKYDQDGNVRQSVDARGGPGTVYAGYDGIDRPQWRNSTDSPSGAYETFSYDSTTTGNQGVGRLTSETFTGGPNNAVSGSYSYVYDARGQETTATLTVGATNYPVQNRFDDAGNTLTQTYPTGETVTTGYTAQGWLNSLSTTLGNTTLLSNAGYTGFGGAAQRLTSANLDGTTYAYTASFDPLLRATDLKVATSSATLFEQSRGFDAAGNVTAANTTLPTGTDNQAFCYDEQDRLTWAGSAGTPPCGIGLTPGTLTSAQYNQSFSYDNLGRLTNGPLGPYTYGNSAHLHAATAIGSSYTAAYDASGDMTCRAPSTASTCAGTQTGAQLTYDTEGSLTAWQNTPSNPSSSAGFLYDNQGNRVEQQVTQGGTTTTTIYVGNLEEVETTGSTITTTTYYYAAGTRIALAVTQNGSSTFSYLASDGLGSATVALGASGSATASTLYAPYGSARYSSGTMPTDYGFTGQHSDAASGLDYYNARYYDPLAGQFASADTVLPGDGYDLFGLSRYAYVEGNPETRTDPSGKCPWCIGAVIGAAVGAGISYGTQVVGNLQRGQSLGSAMTHVDVGEIGKAALVGAVIGATGGLGAGAALGGRLAIGAAQGAGAQVGDNLLHGRSWNQDVLQSAAFGAATEGLSAEGGAALRQGFKRVAGRLLDEGKRVFRNGFQSGVDEGGGGSAGAMRRLNYEPSPKHGLSARGPISEAAANGQDALDVSLQVRHTSPRRVGIDYAEGQFVVFDQTREGIFHGHVREWEDLEQSMRNLMTESGMADKRGRILY